MESKSIIIKAIEDKRKQMMTEYDSNINKELNDDNIANSYYLLAETFQNTMEQGELGIKFLKSTLTNDFFKSAIVENGMNYIIFSNKDFQIMFSKCLSKEIKIQLKNGISFEHHYPTVNDYNAKLADLIQAYLNTKSLKDLNILATFAKKEYNKDFISLIIKYINIKKTCNKELLDKIRRAQELDRIKELKVNKTNNKFLEQQIYAKKFIESLTDLEQFKDSGWYITTIGIQSDNGSFGFGM